MGSENFFCDHLPDDWESPTEIGIVFVFPSDDWVTFTSVAASAIASAAIPSVDDSRGVETRCPDGRVLIRIGENLWVRYVL